MSTPETMAALRRTCATTAVWLVAVILGGQGGDALLIHSNTSDAVWQPGSTAVLCGLQGRPELNGRRGRILGFDSKQRRYLLRLEHGPRARVDPDRLLTLSAAALDHRCQSSRPANASVEATSALGVRAEHAGCSEACDACYAGRLDAALKRGSTPVCFAVCRKGCQTYCDESTAGIPGCSKEELWVADVPGKGAIPEASAALGPKHGPRCTFDHGRNTSCNRFRWCFVEDVNGCPEDYLY
eukprot:TRINITY_DN30097_c0_g1_i1.p1 TRINITY_DN30097_c0_g1~~TRINITY_DN30097_c0_g1_i1.p1  ORF type:complete len:241 (-),score=43.06 TRINITY_DN30097_c0_g1_i1:249-971(-)